MALFQSIRKMMKDDNGDMPPPPQGGGTVHHQHTTTVTMTSDSTPTAGAAGARVTEINMDIGYFKTPAGMLKIVQIVSDIWRTAAVQKC